MPTPPGTCSPLVLSVAVSCQAAGSVVPVFHTLARTVVGEVPSAWTRSCNDEPTV